MMQTMRLQRHNLLLLTILIFCRLAGAAVLASVQEGNEFPSHRKLRRLYSRQVESQQYLVVLSDAVVDIVGKVEALMKRHSRRDDTACTMLFVYKLVLRGFTLANCSEHDITPFLDDSDVLYAVEDEMVRGNSIQDASERPWLDRLDERQRPLDGLYEYLYDGSGVKLYILDTGVRSTHEEFSGNRVVCGFNAYEGIEPCEDNAGHGTFIAALAGGATRGIAKNATIINVRVLNQRVSGTVARIAAGLEYVANEKRLNPSQPMVVSMSIGTLRPFQLALSCAADLFRSIFKETADFKFGCLADGRSESQEFVRATEALIDAGVFVATSAGNGFIPSNACLQAPAKSSKVLTVGSITDSDFRWSFSNYGQCVDIFAPGKDIESAWYSSDNAVQVMSGTSASAPQAAGVAALHMQRDVSLIPSQLKQIIVDDASAGVWFKGPFSPNRILSTVELLTS